jgi:nucleoside-diphosphate-sugar epimerase
MSTAWRRARVLVTGGTGFVGRFVAETLAERGHHVRCVVRRPEKAGALAARGMDVVSGDLADAGSLRAAAHGREAVVHAAAQVGDWAGRSAYEDANVGGTRNLLDAAEAMGATRFVQVSSVAVYGHRRGLIDEAAPFAATGDGYIDTKIAAEQLVWERHRAGRLQCTAVRPCIVYGPYDWKFVPRVAQGLEGGRVPLVAGGAHRAPIVSVRDVAELVAECMVQPAASGEAFHCASTEVVLWKRLLEEVALLIGARVPRFSVPFWMAYGVGAVMEAVYRLARSSTPPVMTRYAAELLGTPVAYDMAKAERLLGWRPRVTLDMGLPETVAWIKGERAQSAISHQPSANS